MNRSEAWAMFAASAKTGSIVSADQCAVFADQLLARFDARFRAGGPDLEDSAAARSGRDSLDQRETEQLIVDMLAGYENDPADSDFQRGFLTALIKIADELEVYVQHSTRAQLAQ